MSNSGFADRTRLLDRVLGAPGPELTCDECFDQLDRYVELELAGRDADATVPGMRAHLDGCTACREDRQDLTALLRFGTEHPNA